MASEILNKIQKAVLHFVAVAFFVGCAGFTEDENPMAAHGNVCENVVFSSSFESYSSSLQSQSISSSSLENANAKGDSGIPCIISSSSSEYLLSSSSVYPTSDGDNKNVCNDSFLDPRDSLVYGIVEIGGQVWMSQNLKYACKEGDNSCVVGNLYTWGEVMDSSSMSSKVENESVEPVRGICPEGWHLPSYEEFELLIKNAGPGFNFASFGFNEGIGFWSSKEASDTDAYFIAFDGNEGKLYLVYGSKNEKLAVRCIRN